MLKVRVDHNLVWIGERFAVSFQRTLRVPDDGQVYPLPPSLGLYPVHRVEDYPAQMPDLWREHGGVFIPMYQREALWLGFEAAYWKPNAAKIGVGGINALTGAPWEAPLRDDPQDYIVCPHQPWLDGIKTGTGVVRQFVAMPLGTAYTVEAQVAGTEEFGGIQILVYEPKPGIFPDWPPVRPMPGQELVAAVEEMGLGAGGMIKQKIYPDPYGLDTWDSANFGRLCVHIANSAQYYKLTGNDLPPTPVSARTYADYGLPWFDLYDEAEGDIAASAKLGQVKSIRETDAERGVDTPDAGRPLDVKDLHIKKLRRQNPKKPST